jgi:hypothetical protein
VAAVAFIWETCWTRGWREPIGGQVAGGVVQSARTGCGGGVLFGWLGMRSLCSAVGEVSPFLEFMYQWFP